MPEYQESGQSEHFFSISTGVAEVNGTQLYYEIAGEGHPLVFIQGRSLVDHRMWDDQFLAFAQQYKVVRYDVRGFGKSPDSTETYSQTEDLAALLRWLDIEHAYLLDLGGSIAIDFVHDYPSSVDALILVSTEVSSYRSLTEAMEDLPHVLERYNPIIDALYLGDVSGAVELLLQTLTLPASVTEDINRRLRHMIIENLHLLFDPPLPPLMREEVLTSFRQWLTEITVPTLILVGERALSEFRLSALILEKCIQGARKCVLSDARFLLNIEQPEQFNRSVLDFLHRLAA
jgi:3-oxoadipate enol-lactonase